MAVVGVELAEHPTAEHTKDGVSITELWNVWCGSAADSLITVLSDPALPALEAKYLGTDSQVVSRKPRKMSQKPDGLGRYLYRVEVRYERVPGGELNPLLKATVVSANGADTEEIHSFYDLDGKPVRNSAGDFIPKGMPITLHHGIFTLSRVTAMTAVQRPGWVQAFQGVASASPFYGIPTGVVMVRAASAEPFDYDGVEYTKLSADFKVHALGWRWDRTEILDAGLNWLLKPAGGVGDDAIREPVKVPFRAKDGTLATEPQPLDGEGGIGDAEDPKYFKRRGVRTANLYGMGL